MLSTAIKALAFSLTLPLFLVALFTLYFAIGWTRPIERDDLEYGYRLLSIVFLLSWPASVPLSLALLLLHRRSRLAAYLLGAPLMAISALGFIVATLTLSLVIFIGTALLSIPAWFALVIAALFGSRPETPARPPAAPH